MKTSYYIPLLIMAAFLVSGCASRTPKSAETSNIPEPTVSELVSSLAPEALDADLMERGVRACAALWRSSDGTKEEFCAFVKEHYAATPEAKQRLHDHLSAAFEAMAGCYNELTIRLQRPTVLTGDEPHEVDYLLSAFNPRAHLTEDLFANKLAFITALNFPYYSLEEKNTLGIEWSNLEWSYARLGDYFTSRTPAWLGQIASQALANAENYIASYNIHMGCLLTEDGERLFPDDMVLLSHWNLRDEIKACYADAEKGLEKQAMIAKVMEHIVRQTIPACVIDNADMDWKPYSNLVYFPDGREIGFASEDGARYARILEVFHADLQADPYYPQMPTSIQRNFEGGNEVSAEEMERLFVDLLSSPVAARVANLIRQRLGRDLQPFDIWYDGFKSRATLPEDDLTRQTRALYPNAAAFKKGMPAMLRNLGFPADEAEFIASKIEVEGARGSGHAWPTESRFQPSLLRTRIGAEGMDYKGYNIAVHEMGHNVEETMDMYFVEPYPLSGIPNNALTEAMAFVFQKRDLQLLGYPAATIDDNTTLDIFWGAFEIMGVALTDMYTWRWLYAHRDATPAQLGEAVASIACEVWNRYFEPLLGTHDCPLLAVYSHMVNAPMYLPSYPYGTLVEYQVEEYLSQFGTPSEFAAQLKRIWSQGRLTPAVWMQRAVGAAVSADPLIRAAARAVDNLENAR